MKRYFLVPPLLLIIFFCAFVYFFKPSYVYAENCTGQSGGSGTCEAPMACPSDKIDRQGTCSDSYQICCLTTLPPGDGGSGDCSDTCSTSADCLDNPNNLSCLNGVCTNPTICQSCTGGSGYPGSCLTPGQCAGMGKNSGDGTGGCSGGSICCSNAPSSETCTINGEPPFLVGAFFYVNLNSSEENTSYIITTTNGCLGSCQAGVKTNSTGQARCTLDCGPPAGSYTIKAQHGAVICETSIEVLNEPGPRCVGDSGASGWCVAMMCPQNTIPDGQGSCATQNNTGCCIPDSITSLWCDADKTKINTAIGCIPVGSGNELITAILNIAIGIGGGIALALILYGVFIVTTSAGMPDKLKAGSEIITSAVVGLIFILLSIFLVNLIGINILGIPGLS